MRPTCAIDLSVLNTRFPTGISRYTKRIAGALIGLPQNQLNWLTLGTSERFDSLGSQNCDHLPYEFPLHDLDAYQRESSAILAIEDVDLYFSTYYPLPDRINSPCFLTIFDLLPIKHPDWFPNRNSYRFFNGPLRNSARQASHIFAISEATKNDIRDLYEIDEEKITVTPLASILDTPSVESPERPLQEPYFLCVCTLEPRKNLERTLRAFERLLEANSNLPHRLMIVGAYGWKSQDLQSTFAKLGDRVCWAGYLSDSELSACYKHAEALVFVSLAEGFGLPLLEAMTYGTPVITSNCSSMPEVAGDAGLYCDPLDIDSIADAWSRILDNSIRESLSIQAVERAQQFNWKSTAQQTLSPMLAILQNSD